MDFNQLLELLRALDTHEVDYVKRSTVRPQDQADAEALREAFPREVE